VWGIAYGEGYTLKELKEYPGSVRGDVLAAVGYAIKALRGEGYRRSLNSRL